MIPVFKHREIERVEFTSMRANILKHDSSLKVTKNNT